MLPFLMDLVSGTPPRQLIDRLVHTAYDELMVIDLAADTYRNRYHTDGKFFSPVLDGSFHRLVEYVSSHMVHPDDREKHLAFLDIATMSDRLAGAKPSGILETTVRYLALDGNWRRMQHLLISGPEYGLGEREVYFYLYDVREMTGREKGQYTETAASSERLRNLMPDLLAENSFFALAQERMNRLEGQWCMIAVDVKHFKLFLELNGQEKGDQLLVRFAEHLHRTAEITDGLSCYRGQDDFGLMIPFDQVLIDRLFQTLRQEIDRLSGTSGFFPLFGICMIYDTSTSAVDQFNHAALTAEEIKDDLRFHIRVYDPDTHERHVEEFRLLSDFSTAIGNGEIQFHLQPQVNVENGKIVGAESLARWKKPDGTYLSPAVFVPVLEKYGVITDLDVFVWEQVCVWLRKLIDRGIRPVPVSVNVSRINIFTVDVPSRLDALLKKYDLDASLLEVEITESAYVEDNERIRQTCAELRRRGFRVLMDDFGSGYSSLNMLRSISVDVIKLDAQFLHFSIGEELKGINILESVINMTKSLSIPMIVEGVETPSLVRYLKDMGVRYMQGFHYYRPMPPDQFGSMLSLPGNADYHGIVLQRSNQMHVREFLDDSIYSDAMLNNILGAVVFYSREGEDLDIVRFNSQFARLTGLEADALEERRHHIQHFFHPEDLPAFHQMLDSAVRDRINGAEGFFRIFRPNGSIIWMQIRAYYLRSEGKQDIFYASAADSTEMQYINYDLPGGYYRCAVTDKYEFLYVSQGFLDMLGYTREELKTLYNDEFVRLIHPDDVSFVAQESHNTVHRDVVDYTPFRIRHRDGHYLYVVEQSQLTEHYGGLTWQSIMIDITEVMTLRNRMRLLEDYSTDCILFIHRLEKPISAEIAIYGFNELLGMDGEAFLKGLTGHEILILDGEGKELYPRLKAQYEKPSVLNGTYTLSFPDGRHVRMHLRFDRIHDESQDVECIISFSASTVQ